MSGIESGTDVRDLVAAMSTALADASGGPSLPAIFEHHVQQILAMRSVRLREIPSRYQARLVTPTRTSESIVLEVPTADPAVQAVLEASFDRGRVLRDRDYDLLNAAAQLGGLVLEAARTRRPSAEDLSKAAAQLVGTSAVMAVLRDRIARVAATDFTVLIEGESDPQ